MTIKKAALVTSLLVREIALYPQRSKISIAFGMTAIFRL